MTPGDRLRERLAVAVHRVPDPVRAAAGTVALVAAAFLDAGLNYPGRKDWTFWASLAAAAALLLRRRYPRLVLLATLPGLYAGTALIAAMGALYTLAASRRWDWQGWTGAALIGIGLFVPWPPTQIGSESASDETQRLIYAVVLSCGPAALGLLVQTRAALSQRIVELATLRDQERELHAQTVIARERARIAREMHDVVSHQAGLIAVQAGALQVTARDPEVRETAATLRGLAVATLEELRSMILVLRAAGAGPTELAPQPRLADLPRLVAESEVDAHLTLHGTGDAALAEPVERAAYRSVQEALTNVRKYAPGAHTQVEVAVEPGELRVAVVNGPPRTDADRERWPGLPGGGQGLVGLRERAGLLGGRVDTGPTPEGGFALHVSLPLHPVGAHRDDGPDDAPGDHRERSDGADGADGADAGDSGTGGSGTGVGPGSATAHEASEDPGTDRRPDRSAEE